MRRHVDVQSRLCDAVQSGIWEDVANALNSDDFENPTEPAGRTALICAVCMPVPNMKIIRLLLDKGFDPLQQTEDSMRSAFHFASATGNVEVRK